MPMHRRPTYVQEPLLQTQALPWTRKCSQASRKSGGQGAQTTPSWMSSPPDAPETPSREAATAHHTHIRESTKEPKTQRTPPPTPTPNPKAPHQHPPHQASRPSSLGPHFETPINPPQPRYRCQHPPVRPLPTPARQAAQGQHTPRTAPKATRPHPKGRGPPTPCRADTARRDPPNRAPSNTPPKTHRPAIPDCTILMYLYPSINRGAGPPPDRPKYVILPTFLLWCLSIPQARGTSQSPV
ncbi:extensin-like [Gouania willdenowi]|uniref:extensin-like n=1 Tax=Gouania willdenowi TaxID=441366 RepID=UPI0010551820|nr:extensin-like [Gouania willdenowi]